MFALKNSRSFFLFIFLALLIPFSSVGQVDSMGVVITQNISDAPFIDQMQRAEAYDAEEFVGNAFLEQDWNTGIVFAEGQYYGHYAMKVDLVKRLLIFQLDNQELTLPSDKFNHFGIANERSNEFDYFFKSEDFSFKSKPDPSFVEHLIYGNYDLYIAYEGRIKKPNENQVIMGGDDRLKLEVKQKFYIDKSGKLILLKNRKDVIEQLDRRKRRKIERYVKENKLKFKTKEDFLLLFNYLSEEEKNAG